MGDGPKVKYGVTDPISLQLPAPKDEKLTSDLAEFINREAPEASQEELQLRNKILRELLRLVQEWVYEVGLQQGLD